MTMVQLADVKWQLQIEGSEEDAQLTNLLKRAESTIEGWTGLVLEQREVTQAFDGFDQLELRFWPIDPTDHVELTYADAAGDDQVVDCRLLAAKRPARLVPAMASGWPIPCRRASSVTATFTAGFYDEPPEGLKQAVLVLVGGWYADREGGKIAQAAEAAAFGLMKRAGFRLVRI